MGQDIDSAQLPCKLGANQLIADQYVSSRAANQVAPLPPPFAARGETGLHYPNPSGDQIAPEIRVRERCAAPEVHGGRRDHAESPAHPSKRLVAQLNESWRVVDDPLQWKLQRKKGNPRGKNLGWQNRAHCSTREGLLACIREYCCLPNQGKSGCVYEYRGVNGGALQQVRALPEWHIDWNCTPRIDPDDDALALAPATDEKPQ